MPKCIYYISWFTWMEEDTQTPWDFWYLKQGSRIKPKKNSSSKTILDEEQIAHAFTSGDQNKLDKLEQEFITDVKLLAFVDAESSDHAQSQVRSVFADAEFDKCEQVDSATKDQILAMIYQTLRKHNQGQE